MENNNSTKGFLHPLTDARIFMAEAMKREDAEAKKWGIRNFTISELNSMSNKKFAALILSEELGKRGNPYTPIANKLRSAISELEGDAEKQMPRILTQQEVFSTEFDGHVYVEILGVITPALVTWKTRETKQNWFAPPRNVTERFIATQQLEGNWLVEEDYEITWRCWNIMPSAEDCKNAPWDVQESNQVASDDCGQEMKWDCDFAISDSVDPGKYTELQLKALWSQFEDIPVDPVTGLIEVPFLHFGPGTHREEIWKWFDEVYPNGVNGLVCGE